MADTLAVANARIFTENPDLPVADSVTITDGRIESVDQRAPSSIQTIDCGGRPVLPGLIDAHMHLLNGGLSLQHLDLAAVRSRADFEKAIEQRHRVLPANQWLIAHGWSSENWGGNEPNKSWLASADDRPVVCHRMDHHAVLINEPVLNLLDCAHDPPGGRIIRDAAGQPTGLMVEAAAWKLVNPIIPQPTAAQKQDALLAAQSHCHKLGLTIVGSMEYTANVQEVFEPLRDRLTLRSRVTLLDRDWPLDVSEGESLRQRNDDHLAVIGYKAFLDGTLGSRTALLLEDYTDDPGNRGLILELARDEFLQQWAQHVTAHGFSPSMHAIGDAAARLALDVIDELGLRADRGAIGARVEHAQQLDPADIPRFHDAITSMQPLHLADDGRYAERRLGFDRLRGSFAFRSLLQAGAILAFGSDWPIVSADPLAGARAAVTGLTSDGTPFLIGERISIAEALHAYTIGAARALNTPDAGVIRPGAFGDLVVLDRDPFSADWVNNPPTVSMTIAGGQVVYDASDDG